MVLVDTSVWIGLYRKKELPVGELVWSLVAKNGAAICGQTLVEFLGGFRSELEQKRMERSFLAFPFLETTPEAYLLAAKLLAEFPKLGSGDCIIAATAIQSASPLLTLDKDFRLLEKRGLQLL